MLNAIACFYTQQDVNGERSEFISLKNSPWGDLKLNLNALQTQTMYVILD